MPIGDIGDSIQQYEFNSTYGRHPTIQCVRPNLYCIGYEKTGSKAQVETYFISDAGVITTPAEATLEISTAAWLFNQSCIRPAQNFVLVNAGSGGSLYLEAVIVANDGTLSQHANHACYLDPFDSQWFNAVYQRGSIITIFCRHGNDKPYVFTNVVGADGEVSDPIEDWDLIEDTTCTRVQGIRISEGVALIVYHRGGVDLYARPVGIAADGTISGLAQATTQISTVDGPPIRLIHLTGDWFLLSIEGPDTELNLCAFQCAADGTITVPANNSYLVFDGRHKQAQITKLTDNMISIFSTDASDNAWLQSVQITLSDPVVWSVHASKNIGPDINNAWGSLLVASGVLVLSYSDVDDDGWLWTYGLTTEEPALSHNELIMGIGP